MDYGINEPTGSINWVSWMQVEVLIEKTLRCMQVYVWMCLHFLTGIAIP